jgi:hypothetical protein
MSLLDSIELTRHVPHFGQWIAGYLTDDALKADALLDAWLAAKGIAEDARPAAKAKINRIALASSRILWRDRKRHAALANLTAPQFLRKVYADLIDANGILIDQDAVRFSDAKLVSAVQSYVATRATRTLDAGEAKGLHFNRKDARGRPSRAIKNKVSADIAPP